MLHKVGVVAKEWKWWTVICTHESSVGCFCFLGLVISYLGGWASITGDTWIVCKAEFCLVLLEECRAQEELQGEDISAGIRCRGTHSPPLPLPSWPKPPTCFIWMLCQPSSRSPYSLTFLPALVFNTRTRVTLLQWKSESVKFLNSHNRLK